MSDPFVAEIRIFAGNFAPKGWAFCNGQVLSISQNTALFSLVGTFYGGNGQTNFALPNLQGAAPLQQGQGPGLSPYFLGETGGTEAVTLLASEMPAHTHAVNGVSTGGQGSPTNNAWGALGRGRPAAYAASGTKATMSGQALSIAGGSQPHDNMQPYLVLNFIISLLGIFPERP